MAPRKKRTVAKAAAVPESEAIGTQETGEKSVEAFPIVGIGASAGGLAAFEAFFSGMPPDTDPGMAFVLVQHLAPDHKSILKEIIQRYTRMQVLEVEDGMAVQPNCTYIIPPNRDMAFLNGALQLLEPSAPRGQRLPIDFFFRSLAQDQHERAICVVLSGTGSDGALGVRAVKGEGGMVMAQNPDSTEYDGMPRSAIATGLVDFELPPAEMPSQIAAYVAHAFGKPHRAATPPLPKVENALKKICILLRAHTGHDFSQYKPSTIQRRIERRQAVHQIDAVTEYVKFLQQTPAELDALFRDLLIGVTSFFRDPEAFAAFNDQALPRLLEGKPPGSAIRVWVPGCSTGEEAYSIAILLHERLEALKQRFRVQVFATDIDGRAIAIARAGIYPASVAGDITPERLARHFVPDNGLDAGSPSAYRIHKSIRDLLVFSEQDLVRDPPFSKLDLISCRNLLIYLGADLQKRLIPLFHYALSPGGFLFLGTSESVGEFADLFSALDRKAKLYERIGDFQSARRTPLGRMLPALAPHEGTLPGTGDRKVPPEKLPLRELAERAILQEISLAGVLVNGQGDILYLHGRTGQYIELAPGEIKVNNILKMAREGLRRELATALHKARAAGEIVRHSGLRVKTNGDYSTVNLTVRPVAADPAAATPVAPELFLIVLEEVAADSPARPGKSGGGVPVDGKGEGAPDADAQVAALRQELRTKEEYLQASNEELETSNEELKSSNEEMQSVNEELQSTNEELETSKEELQSVNEELSTVNAELQTKVADLSHANNDMNNLLAGTGIGTVFVDHQLRVLRFTPAVTQIINFILSDVGRPVSHIVSNLAGYDRLAEDVKSVLDTLVSKEVEVQTAAGRWFTMRIQPYRTLDNVIEGAVITFADITGLKEAQAALREGEGLQRLATVVRDSNDAITVQDLEGRTLAWNPGAARLYGWSEEEALAMNVHDRIPESCRADELETIRKLARSRVLKPYNTQRIARDGATVNVSVTATALVNEDGTMYAIATTERNRESKTS